MIDVSAAHLALIEMLADVPDPDWGETALLSCLQRLQAGGPTEAAEVQVHGGWSFDNGFCLVYDSPWGPTVGLRVTANGTRFAAAYTSEETAIDFGIDIADFTVAEPMGKNSHSLVFDSNGLGWWGDAPYPQRGGDNGLMGAG